MQRRTYLAAAGTALAAAAGCVSDGNIVQPLEDGSIEAAERQAITGSPTTRNVFV